MKKTRILAFLVTICMATTAFLGGTIAKYSTTEDIEDTATVAKWGIQLKMSGSLFGNAYLQADGNNPVKYAATTGINDGTATETTISVHAQDTRDVVAPGTKGNTITLSLTGKAEVDSSVEVSATEDNLKDVYLAANQTYATMVSLGNTITEQEYTLRQNDLYTKSTSGNINTYTKANAYSSTQEYYLLQMTATVGAGGYYPVVYTVTGIENGNTTYTKTKDIVDAVKGKLMTATIENAVTTYSAKTYDTNHEFNTNITITWEWKFTDNNDPADTILGYLAQGSMTGMEVVKLSGNGNDYVSVVSGTDYNLSTNFNISITVDQVD